MIPLAGEWSLGISVQYGSCRRRLWDVQRRRVSGDVVRSHCPALHLRRDRLDANTTGRRVQDERGRDTA